MHTHPHISLSVENRALKERFGLTQQPRPIAQPDENSTSVTPLHKRRFILWTNVLTLGLFATMMLVTSTEGPNKVGLLISGAWLLSILFNSYILDTLMLGRKQTASDTKADLGITNNVATQSQ